MKISKRSILLVILLILVLSLFLPVKVQYSFESKALIYPLQEWHLKRGQDDSFLSELVNYQTNVISHLKNYKFERGDIAEVILKNGMTSGAFVLKNDTIGYIHSFFIENEIEKLKNLKVIELDALSVSASGEKESLIAQAQQQHEYAKEQLKLEQKNFERQQKLYNDSIISAADYELAENSFRLAEINAEITYKELIVLKTGQKPEEIAYIRQKIDAYDREIAILEQLKLQYFLITPVGGMISYNRVLDGIITISDTSEYILNIPVEVNNIQYLQHITGIRFSIPGYEQKIDASFLSLDERVNLLPTQQMAIAKAAIAGSVPGVYPGMAVQCKVYCDKISLLNYLKRGINASL